MNSNPIGSRVALCGLITIPRYTLPRNRGSAVPVTARKELNSFGVRSWLALMYWAHGPCKVLDFICGYDEGAGLILSYDERPTDIEEPGKGAVV